MFSPLRHLARRLFRFSPPKPEVSRLVVGSTGSGKSEGELVDLVRLAGRRDCAVVLLDAHGPLAVRTVGEWVARRHEPRIVYEPVHDTSRVLGWNLLPPSLARTPGARRLELAETRDDLVQCFIAPRNLGTLADRPLTREWLEAAVSLALCQPDPEPFSALPFAFQVGSSGYKRLLAACTDPALVGRFRELELLKRKNVVQYDIQVGAARRLVEQVCGSEVVRLRSGGGDFDWLAALRDRSLVAFDGGGVRSRELKRTLFLLASLHVIHAVRRHFAETQSPLPVVLVLEEAGALGLVTPFVLSALQELRKAGLAVHVITQSVLDFGEPGLFEAVLANTPWQGWYQCLSPADQEMGARALGNATFDPHAVHYARTRQVRDGVESVATESYGEGFDHNGHPVRHDTRTGTTFLTRYREEQEVHYKTPRLHEQEYRTKLATLRVGERIVRTRDGVKTERVKALPTPGRRFEPLTREAMERIRSRPIYRRPATPPEVDSATPLPDAAERLRSLTTNAENPGIGSRV